MRQQDIYHSAATSSDHRSGDIADSHVGIMVAEDAQSESGKRNAEMIIGNILERCRGGGDGQYT